MKSNGKLLFLLLISFIAGTANSQTIIPDLKDTSRWALYNQQLAVRETNLVELSASPEGGMMVLKDPGFTNGTIELDIKGENKPQQNFVGLAFNIRSETLYECIYFRPFNFRNEPRKDHSVQYIFPPAYHWETLRTNFPGKYEAAIKSAPDPDQWFHVRITILDKTVKVFVNNEIQPSLVVERLSVLNGGKLGLWAGNNTKASFKNLRITPEPAVAYGYQPAKGNFFEVAKETRLYYEIYGEGEPVLLLHGGVYGYIDEFEYLIKELAQTNRVICLATRGHVKSDIGHEPFTYGQRAADAKKLLDHLGIDSAAVIGFSDGGYSAYKLAADYPGSVKKLVVIGAGDRAAGTREAFHYSAKDLEKNNGAYFKKRLAAMPEPQRWDESLQMLNRLYNVDMISSETFAKIKCPVLLLAGDRDAFSPPASLLKVQQLLANARLSIIPGCGHVVFYCNWPAVWNSIRPFLYAKN